MPELHLIVRKNRFVKHEFSPLTQTLYSLWTDETELMTDDEFKAEMLAWENVVNLKKPQFLIDDCRKFYYTISPANQQWSARLLNKALTDCGLKKYAHITPDEFISNIATMQYFDIFFEMNLPGQFPVEHFTEISMGEKWLFA
jgi:hypothetical protein